MKLNIARMAMKVGKYKVIIVIKVIKVGIIMAIKVIMVIKIIKVAIC